MKKLITACAAAALSLTALPAAQAAPDPIAAAAMGSSDLFFKVASPQDSFIASLVSDNWRRPGSPFPQLQRCAETVDLSSQDPALHFFAANFCLKFVPGMRPSLGW